MWMDYDHSRGAEILPFEANFFTLLSNWSQKPLSVETVEAQYWRTASGNVHPALHRCSSAIKSDWNVHRPHIKSTASGQSLISSQSLKQWLSTCGSWPLGRSNDPFTGVA